MSKPWVLGAQLSTSHTATGLLTPERVDDIIRKATTSVDLQILIVGAREVPDVFTAVTRPGHRPAGVVFLWYNLLSDIAGMETDDLVVDWKGERSSGWGWWASQDSQAEETFRFVCPNNPGARRKTLSRLRELMERYAFDGVFFDKCRFPSPANGIEQILACFCDHCHSAARSRGLDLTAVARIFETKAFVGELTGSTGTSPPDANWLLGLLAPDSLLARFVQFRRDSVTGLVREAHTTMQGLGRKVSFDLFSAGLAPLVGQDYAALSKYAAWTKPMTYRTALGPASLRLEVPSLMDGFAKLTGYPLEDLSRWAARSIPHFEKGTLTTIREEGVPIPIMVDEVRAAVRQMHPAPIYAGIETVSYPGLIDVHPPMVASMVRAAREGGAAGAIVSWDLIYTPEENLIALKGDA